MRLGTHLLAGWAVANGAEVLPGKGLDARGRRLVVLASLAPLLDGVHVFWNQRRFQEVHHEYTCSLPVGLLVVALLVPFASRGRRLQTALACALAFSLNACIDMVTTNWPVRLFYPLSDFRWAVGGLLSDFIIYQVIGTVCDLFFIGLVVAIFIRWWRTPFELFGRRVDDLVIDFLRLPWRHRCVECGRRATYLCQRCGATVCGYHVRVRRLLPHCAKCAGKGRGGGEEPSPTGRDDSPG